MDRVVHIFSYLAAKRFLETPESRGFSVLLISYVGDRVPFIDYVKSNIETMIHIEFDDVLLAKKEPGAPILSDVRNMLEWARDKNRLVVTCAGGISKSAAAAFLIHCLDKDPHEAIKHLSVGSHDPHRPLIKIGIEVLNNPEIQKAMEAFNDEALSLYT